jgi:hypothetical protein
MTTAAASKKTPKSYLSEEERVALMSRGDIELIYMAESQAAGDAGDEDTAWDWLSLVELPAHSLLRLKDNYGAQFIRDMGFPTAQADAAYGSNWLNE